MRDLNLDPQTVRISTNSDLGILQTGTRRFRHQGVLSPTEWCESCRGWPHQVTELMEGRPYDVFKISLRILVFVEIALEHMNMYMCIYKFYYSRITSIEIINWNPLELKFKLSNSWIFGTILQTDLYSETVHHQFIDSEDPKFIWWLKNGSFLGGKSQAFREDEFGPHLP